MSPSLLVISFLKLRQGEKGSLLPLPVPPRRIPESLCLVSTRLGSACTNSTVISITVMDLAQLSSSMAGMGPYGGSTALVTVLDLQGA